MAAVRAAAIDEFTSPGTRTISGRSAPGDRLEALHYARDLDGIRRRPDAEHVIRLAQAELFEEDRRQPAVVVLARMDQDVLERLGLTSKHRRDRRDLHHVRPRSHDRQHAQPPPAITSHNRPVWGRPPPTAASRAQHGALGGRKGLAGLRVARAPRSVYSSLFFAPAFAAGRPASLRLVAGRVDASPKGHRD